MRLPPESTFPLAEEYMQLQEKLEPEGWMGQLLLLNDMVFQPVWLFVQWVVWGRPSHFAILSCLVRTVQIWSSWARYQVLRDTARNWVLLTKLAGGPFIGCNDPKYHVFVYAEAIERLRLLGGGSWTPRRRRGPERRHRVA
jgi:hypothetical protein